MNDKTGRNRGPRRAGALAVIVAAGMLSTACGIVHVHFGSAPAGPVTVKPNPAFVRCMRSHGLTRFPSGSKAITVQTHGNDQAVRAYDACKHLLPPGSGG